MTQPGHVLCFGEIMLRLSPPASGYLLQQPQLDANFAGAEANVAVALARLGKPSAMVSAIPDTAIGDAAIENLRRYGVNTSRIRRPDGRLGIYYLTPGIGKRASSIVYDRLDSAFSRQRDYDWPRLLEGASWLHLSGINCAIGADMAAVTLAAMRAAKQAGVRVSFDCNYRASMWARWCADPAPILAEHIRLADLMFGNHRDISLLLGRSFDGSGPDRRREAALAAFAAFPELKTIASTARIVTDARHNALSARIDTPTDAHQTAVIDIPDIVDRIGTGDAFAAGVLAEIDSDLEAAALSGLHLAVLKHWTPGDQSQAGPRELAAFANQSLDVQR